MSGFPNERVAMDVLGPIKESKNGNKYILCITDHFSKFTKAIPMPDQTAERVAKIFVQDWVYMWGEPTKLHTDQGTNFESILMKNICEHLEVEKTRTTPYHPQGNAQVERYNQSIMTIVSKLVDKENYENWDDKLPISVSAYNATEHATTQKTPNRLMFGREVSHNFDKMLPAEALKDD
jgi:transposase InsO family protein